MSSRSELQLQKLLGDDVEVEPVMSRFEELLECIRLNKTYDEEPRSRLEQYLKRILDNVTEIPKTPIGRLEYILDSIIEYKDLTGMVPKSKLKELLIRLRNEGLLPLDMYQYITTPVKELHLTNSVAAPIENLKLYGESTQKNTTGSNLFDIDTMLTKYASKLSTNELSLSNTNAYSFANVQVETGKKYYVSFEYNASSGNPIEYDIPQDDLEKLRAFLSYDGSMNIESNVPFTLDHAVKKAKVVTLVNKAMMARSAIYRPPKENQNGVESDG